MKDSWGDMCCIVVRVSSAPFWFKSFTGYCWDRRAVADVELGVDEIFFFRAYLATTINCDVLDVDGVRVTYLPRFDWINSHEICRVRQCQQGWTSEASHLTLRA